MKGKKFTSAAVAAIAILTLSAAALSMGMRDGGQGAGRGMKGHAGMGMMGGMGGHGMMGLGLIEKALDNPAIVEEIGLSAAQKTKIQNLVADTQKQHIAARAEIQTLQIDLDNLMKQDSPNLSMIEAKIDDIGMKTTALHKNSVRTSFEIKKTLTQEQLDKIKTLATERMKERGRDGERGERKGMDGGKKGGEWKEDCPYRNKSK